MRSKYRATPTSSSLGTLHDGDRVDIVGTWSFPEGQQDHVSKVVLRDIKVPARAGAVRKVAGKLGASANDPYAAIIAISDTQSRKLFWLMKNGEWTLQLRPVAKATDSADGFDTSGSLLKGGAGKAARKVGR